MRGFLTAVGAGLIVVGVAVLAVVLYLLGFAISGAVIYLGWLLLTYAPFGIPAASYYGSVGLAIVVYTLRRIFGRNTVTIREK